MNENQKPEPVDLGIYSRKSEPYGIAPADIIGIALTVLWLLGALLFFSIVPDTQAEPDPLRHVMTVLAVVLPIAVIWVGVIAARGAGEVRRETVRLQASVDAMRQAYLQTQQSQGAKASVEKKLEELSAAQRKTESAIATFTSIRQGASAPAGPAAQPTGPDGQAMLALDTADERVAPPLSAPDLIRALNFPETADDKDGFRSLRRALEDHRVAPLIQAAQDVLTLLSQDGIYMDDLTPDRSRPEVWRQFAQGERGRAVAGLGGIRDRSSLALSAGRMRQDPIFRDTVHHFLRKFDRALAEFEQAASDQEIVALTDTRSARAFMLLGRVTRTFD